MVAFLGDHDYEFPLRGALLEALPDFANFSAEDGLMHFRQFTGNTDSPVWSEYLLCIIKELPNTVRGFEIN